MSSGDGVDSLHNVQEFLSNFPLKQKPSKLKKSSVLSIAVVL
jgi:hypothetical protein